MSSLFYSFKSIFKQIKLLPPLEKCHRQHCSCIHKISKEVLYHNDDSLDNMTSYTDYKKCLQLSKDWKQKNTIR